MSVTLSPCSPSSHIHTLTEGHGTGSIASPEAFLKAIGRKSETKVSYESWREFWQIDGLGLKKAGVSVQDRRCVGSAIELRTEYWAGLDCFFVARLDTSCGQ